MSSGQSGSSRDVTGDRGAGLASAASSCVGDTDDSDEELGELIYRSSRTARIRADAAASLQAMIMADSASHVDDVLATKRMLPEGGGPAGRPEKRARRICSREGCNNQLQNNGVCFRHGAKKIHKKCSHEGCPNIAMKGGVCWSHGAKRKKCSHEGCLKSAVKGGMCWGHGERATCSHEGCSNLAQKGGVCCSHGAKRICKNAAMADAPTKL